MLWKAAALQVAHWDHKRILLQELVQGGCFSQITFACTRQLRTRNARHARKHVAQVGLALLDVAAEGDPGKRFAGLLQDVVRHAPLAAMPVLQVQRLAPTGQIVEVAASFGFADLLVDRTLPAGLSRTSHRRFRTHTVRWWTRAVWLR